MKHTTALLATLGLALHLAWPATAAPQNDRLWYTQPASEWTEARPLRNGRLGAMVYG